MTTPGEGSFQYDDGTNASIVATADANYHFMNWTGSAVDAGKVAGPVKGGKIVEVFVPLSDLGIAVGDPLEMQLAFGVAGQGKDLAPSLESKSLVDDPTAAVFVTFVCDARGSSAGNPAWDTFEIGRAHV